MSTEATKKATAATAETMDEVFHEAMRSYEKALKSGIQLQEESVNLWKDLLIHPGFTDTPDGAGARGRVHPDQSASANAVETADQAGGNRGCHLLYANERRREWRTLGRCRLAPGHLTRETHALRI